MWRRMIMFGGSRRSVPSTLASLMRRAISGILNLSDSSSMAIKRNNQGNQGQSSDERSRAIKRTCFLTRRSVAAFRKESRCVSTPMTRGKPCTCGEGGDAVVSTCMHSRCVSTPMTRGKPCPWIAAVIKDGLRQSSRKEEAARGDQRIVVY